MKHIIGIILFSPNDILNQELIHQVSQISQALIFINPPLSCQDIKITQPLKLIDNQSISSNKEIFEIAQSWSKELQFFQETSYLFQVQNNWNLIFDKQWSSEELIKDEYSVYFSSPQLDTTVPCFQRLIFYKEIKVLRNIPILSPLIRLQGELKNELLIEKKKWNEVDNLSELIEKKKWNEVLDILSKKSYNELVKEIDYSSVKYLENREGVITEIGKEYIKIIRCMCYLHLNKWTEAELTHHEISLDIVFGKNVKKIHQNEYQGKILDYIYDIIKFYRESGHQKESFQWLKKLPTLIFPSYPWQFLYEMSIVAYYNSEMNYGLQSSNQLLSLKNIPDNIKQSCQSNLHFYLNKD